MCVCVCDVWECELERQTDRDQLNVQREKKRECDLFPCVHSGTEHEPRVKAEEDGE